MKTNPLRWTFGFLLFNSALLFWGTGCATHEEHAFNADYNQNLPTSPKYYIEDLGQTHFTVTVRQGESMATQQRVIFVKRAASTVAETEAKRRGWENWQLEYILERDQGWMHIVKADVIRKNAVEFQGNVPTNKP